jgi:hypothetical protein
MDPERHVAEELVDSYAVLPSPPNPVECALPTYTLLGSKSNAYDAHGNVDEEAAFQSLFASHG